MNIIQFKDVWEMYRIKFIIDGKVSHENFWALKDLSFNIEKGETLGIIGENGAGKSTILKLIMGMLKPDRGEIKVSGRVAGLLELGAGFQTELTGRENIYLNAGLFGFNPKQIEAIYEKIVDFASLGKFINAPVKCYSQGMFVRLAFAIAIHMDPDILLIDDTLAVGDEHFQRKCIKKIFEIKEQGKAIIFVTHDMNMLRRLCKKAIFLKEGKIVKNDLVEKVIPLYTQMMGTREGVGIIEKKPLNLVFNNGRLFLNWQDKLLTPNSGAYAVFLIADKWYSSIQADWEVIKEGENKLFATGKFYQLAFIQIWRLEITDDYVINWDIEINTNEPLEMQEGCINILLTNEYTHWFTTLEKGEFLPISDKDKNWQALLEGNFSRRCIGVKRTEVPDTKIPLLAFKHTILFPRFEAQIYNTDYFTNCRVLQYKTINLKDSFASQVNSLIYFSGQIAINIPDIDNYLKNLQDAFILSYGKLRLAFDYGRFILSYNGINLTKASHMGTSICVNGKWHHSNLANWDVKKEGNNKIVAKVIWQEIPIMQIWEIEIINEAYFLWNINLLINNKIDIEEQRAYFTYGKDYKYWFCKYDEGEFPNTFLENEMDMVQRCIPDGLIGLKYQNNELPDIFLKFSKKANSFAKILNSDFYNKARILRLEKIESEENIKFYPGEYPCFKIEMNLDKDKRIYKKEATNILQGKKLSFVFDKGRGRIYWDKIELTKRLGLYTSLRSGGRWYDSSSSAIWKIEGKNKDTIKALGKWLYLPISQYWKIKLKEDNLIKFYLKMKIDKAIQVDRLQINLMLSERYLQWTSNKEKGIFRALKEDVDDDWDCIWSEQDSGGYVGVLDNFTDKGFLPSVIFLPQAINSGWQLNIINSDVYHRSRVLQYLNTERKIILPSSYSYFSGKIFINSIAELK